MKLKCLHCGHKYDGCISHDELGWHSSCPKCSGSFDVDVPDGRILVLFADRDVDLTPEVFKDNHLDNAIYSYRAYDSVSAFMKKWYQLAENPDSMWYWVLDKAWGTYGYITTGACSIDCDRDLFKDHFGRLSMNREETQLSWIKKAVGYALWKYDGDSIDLVANEETGKFDVMYHSNNNSFAVVEDVSNQAYVRKEPLVALLNELGIGYCL